MSGTQIVRLIVAVSFVSMSCVPFGLAKTTPKPKLSMGDARTIALAKEQGTVKSGELEKEQGRWIYSFDIAHKRQVHEVNVDANTGEIVEDSVENPADEAKEKANEQAAAH